MTAKSNMQKDLEDAADFNLTLEEKVYKSNKISLDLMAQVKSLKLGYDVTTSWAAVGGIYEPVRTDQIDVALADYINWSPYRHPLSRLFVREYEGVYNFGSKKTNVKYEQSELKVRVGGGYLSIDEFVQQYLPLEIEKAGPLVTSGLIGSPLLRSSSPTLKRRVTSPNRSTANIRQSVNIPKQGSNWL